MQQRHVKAHRLVHVLGVAVEIGNLVYKMLSVLVQQLILYRLAASTGFITL
jgi:hypothetical protein